MKENIYITGINGFIGRNLKEFYEDHNIYGLLKKYEPEYVKSNIINFSPDYIIHCAAEIYDEDKMFESNILLTKAILDACREVKNLKKLIIIGSSSEYGRKTYPISEECNLDPTTIYEATKGAASLLAQGYSKTYDIPITIIRPFTIVGRYEKSHKFFPQIMRAYKRDEILNLYPKPVHDYVFIDDFLSIFETIRLFDEKEKFNLINVGSGFQVSNEEIVRIFEEILFYRFKINYIKDNMRSFDSFHWQANPFNLFHKYHVLFKYNLYTGIDKFWEDCVKLKLYDE